MLLMLMNCMDGDCQNQLDAIDHAKVLEPEGNPRECVGSSVNLKKRYYGHADSFRNSDHKHCAILSIYIWEQKLNPTPKIKATSYRKGGRNSDLCLTEKKKNTLKKTSITPSTSTNAVSWPSGADTSPNSSSYIAWIREYSCPPN